MLAFVIIFKKYITKIQQSYERNCTAIGDLVC